MSILWNEVGAVQEVFFISRIRRKNNEVGSEVRFSCCPQIPCVVDPYLSRPKRRVRRAVKKFRSHFTPSNSLLEKMSKPIIPEWLQLLKKKIRSQESVTTLLSSESSYDIDYTNLPQIVEELILKSLCRYGVNIDVVDTTPARRTVVFLGMEWNDVYPIIVTGGVSQMIRCDLLLRLLRLRIRKDCYVSESSYHLPMILESQLQVYADDGEIQSQFVNIVSSVNTSKDVEVVCEAIRDDLLFSWNLLQKLETQSKEKYRHISGVIQYRVTEILCRFIYLDFCLSFFADPMLRHQVNLPLFCDHILCITIGGWDEMDSGQALWEIEYDRVNVTKERLDLFLLYEEKVHGNTLDLTDCNDFEQNSMFSTPLNV